MDAAKEDATILFVGRDLSTKEEESLVVVIGKNDFETLLQYVRLFASPLDGLTTVGIGHVIYQKVRVDVECEENSLIFPAMEAAKEADVTILFVGTDLSTEAESLAR
ncbi:hypothetical protein SLEP1_g57314 [Rubroshorea leprosula]|uniref:Uncharacterized protein n=1 Tax=Rubroshorea leprosula TaxID=152421 RepID=A0AAV5MP53_9ROSI|nr:hypothetical protein SLEP1_g57314 [Rubroshorea leprosula]